MSMLEYPADNVTGIGYLAVPQSSRGPGVVVLHAWWGLNDFFKRFCDKLAGEGFVAFAPDLHQGQTASTIDGAKELMAKRDLDFETTMKQVTGAVELLKTHPAVEKSRFGVVGFSMGGAWSLWLSAQRPENVAAVVVFYGTAGDFVSKSDFTRSQAAFLGHYAETDEWEPIDGVKKLEGLLQSAGKQVEFHFYPNIGHWFFEENRPEYDPESARLAWRRTVQFLHSKIK